MAKEIPGWVERRRVGEEFDVSESTIRRIYEKAVKNQSRDVLRNFQLVTNDGRTRKPADVNPELIKTLKYTEKLEPEWYVRRNFVEKKYGRRSGANGASIGKSRVGEITPRDYRPTASHQGQFVIKLEQLYKEQLAEREQRLHAQKEEHRSEIKELKQEHQEQLRQERGNTEKAQNAYAQLQSVLVKQLDGNTAVLKGIAKRLETDGIQSPRPAEPTSADDHGGYPILTGGIVVDGAVVERESASSETKQPAPPVDKKPNNKNAGKRKKSPPEKPASESEPVADRPTMWSRIKERVGWGGGE